MTMARIKVVSRGLFVNRTWRCCGQFPSRGAGSRRELLLEEVANCARNLLVVSFKCEVAGVIEMDLRVWVISPERVGATGQEERVVLAPDSKYWWALCPEILLELRIQGDIARVIQTEVELELVVAGPA